jgi:hypothetical protein
MSLFIAGQAFPVPSDFAAAKIAVFGASLMAAALGRSRFRCLALSIVGFPEISADHFGHLHVVRLIPLIDSREAAHRGWRDGPKHQQIANTAGSAVNRALS